MKKILKILGYTALGFVGLVILIALVSDPVPQEETQEVFEQEMPEVSIPEEATLTESVFSEEEVSQSETTQAVSNQNNTQTQTQTKTESQISVDSYLVTKVVDGDTLTISKYGKSVALRLIGIDTPETVHPSKPVECFGAEASNKAKSLLSGKYITLETDPTQGELDKYDRMLAYIYLPDGTMFNKYMIEKGYAYEYTYGTPYKYQSQFKQAQKSAQENKRGLWADGVCEEETTPAPVTTQTQTSNPVNTGNYSCSSNIYNCSNFSTHNEAQAVFEMCGGISNDVHGLDNDSDGEACETLP